MNRGMWGMKIAKDHISDFVYERFVKPALENGRNIAVDPADVSRAMGGMHNPNEIEVVLRSRAFRKTHGLSLESVSTSDTGLMYIFRLHLRRLH
jgi:hypothetical protein